MTAWPADFDLRAEVIGLLDLVEMDTPDGPARFMPGVDARFVDIAGREWIGSQLISGSAIEWAREGQAPEGELTLSYFQDPDAPDLIQQLRTLGSDYVRGQAVRFYVQPLGSVAEFSAPVYPPVLVATRVARTLTYEIDGDVSRRLTLSIESQLAARRGARGLYYTTEDHSRLVGAANPSLQFMPSESRVEEQLFG